MQTPIANPAGTVISPGVRSRRFLMCPPEYFDVAYVINPWMDPARPVDSELALRQWEALRGAYEAYGHKVETITPEPGLPDMVYAANSGLVMDGTVLLSRFRYPVRRGEEPAYERWFTANGFVVWQSVDIHEGEGDFAAAGDTILAGTGFRTSLAAHAEVAATFDRPVVSLTLVDPRFYHLDMALCVLHGEQIMYYPPAFSPESRALLRGLYPEAILAGDEDALAFGLNATSDGRHVFLAAEAEGLAKRLEQAGYEPVPVALSELRRGGGGVKCCTLELEAGAPRQAAGPVTNNAGLPPWPETEAIASYVIGATHSLPHPAEGTHPPAQVASARAEPSMSAADLESRWVAPNYSPLPVTLVAGDGAWVTDDRGRRYLDLLAGYSALSFGHRHPRLVAAAHAQLDRLTLTSRAFRSDQLGPFAADLADLCATGQAPGAAEPMVLPMNTGAEAVETAIKAARRWGYQIKGVPRDQAEIIVCRDNFHGRTTTIVGFSSDPGARDDFGPFTPGFVTVPYGDASALRAAVTEHTVAFLVEPVQGEAGVIVPPDGYLAECRKICDEASVLLLADEIQSGLGRTGRTFGCDHEGVRPDLYILGKALGGGIVPLSAVVGTRDVLGLLTTGTHGSTFGGNPLACAVGREVIALLRTGEYQERAAQLGHQLASRLADLVGRGVSAVRSRGLWAGIDLAEDMPSGRLVCELLLERGVLAKDTQGRTIRLAPPIVIDEADLDHALDQLTAIL